MTPNPAGTAVREIPFSRPEYDEAEQRAVAAVLASGWVSQGPKVAEFEARFAERVGARQAVATSSCTTALHLALIVAGIQPGDEVIVPSYTFVATANAVLYVQGTPVFAEIEPDTWNMDPADVMRRITPRTKAVVVVHQFGLPARMEYEQLAARGIHVIEDAACVAGGTYRGKPVGSSGYPACWSFHPRKTVSTGEGGMFTTDDAAVAERARQLRSFAANISDRARHEARGVVFEEYHELGYNYRMTDLQAAIGIEQLAKLDRLLAARARVADRYDRAFASLKDVEVPARPAYATHTYQTYGIRVVGRTAAQRDAMIRALVERGISVRRGIPPVHLEPLYAGRFGRLSLPVTEEVSDTSILLPMFASLADDDQARVIDAVTALAARG
jgi:dTDP-4-amino-4,6-dideoxygalactose transaminase